MTNSVCQNENQVLKEMFLISRQKKTDFQIRAEEAVCRQLYDSHHIHTYLARSGILHADVSYRFAEGLILISDAEYTAKPYAIVNSMEYFHKAVERFRQRNIREFSIVLDIPFFEEINRHPDRKRILMEMSCLSEYRYYENPGRCSYDFTVMKFFEGTVFSCDSQAETVRALQQMKKDRQAGGKLVFTETLFPVLKAENFKRLHELEAAAGMYCDQMRYSPEGCYIIYQDVVFVREGAHVSTLQQAAAYVRRCALEGDSRITLFCKKELQDRLMGSSVRTQDRGDGMLRLADLTSQAGIFHFRYTMQDNSSFTLFIDRYYPGRAILTAMRKGDISPLSLRERQTLEKAVRIAKECADSKKWVTALKIHDYLCKTIVYTIDDTTEDDDTAIGAILDGKANCDGYADAFFLIGTLAGLHVVHMHGDSLERTAEDGATHMWNLLELDGTWRVVDVTWDDKKDGYHHTWFNIGYDRAKRVHLWNEDMYPKLLEKTEMATRPVNEFYVYSYEGGLAAVREAMNRRFAGFVLIFDNASLAEYTDRFVEEVVKFTNGGFRYIWDKYMLMLRLIEIRYPADMKT